MTRLRLPYEDGKKMQLGMPGFLSSELSLLSLFWTVFIELRLRKSSTTKTQTESLLTSSLKIERLYFRGPKLIQSPSLHILMLSVLKQIHRSSTSSTRAVCEEYKKRGRKNLPLDSEPPSQSSWYENMCHLGLRFCSDNSRLFSLITTLAKSVRSTKSEVMMLTPSTPGL